MGENSDSPHFQDLIQQLTKQAGLSDTVAKQVIEIVLNGIKAKLPPAMAQQLDGLLKGGDASGTMGTLMKGLGGMLGGGK